MVEQDGSDGLPDYPRTTERRATVNREYLVHAWAGPFTVIAKAAREAERMLAQAYEMDKLRISQLNSYRIDRAVEAYRLRVTVYFADSGETQTGGIDLLDDPDVRSEPVNAIVIENNPMFTGAPTIHVRFGTRVGDERVTGGAYVKVVGPTREWSEGVLRRLQDEVGKGRRWWDWFQRSSAMLPSIVVLGFGLLVLINATSFGGDLSRAPWSIYLWAWGGAGWIILALQKYVLLRFVEFRSLRLGYAA